MSDAAGSTPIRVAMVVPTYNEVENVEPLAERVLGSDPRVELLVVDDASPDGTGALCDEIAAKEPRFHVLHRTGPRGYAPASREGLLWALESAFDVVGTMDGDLSHDPARIPVMLERIADGADLVIGSRYVDGGALQVDWGPVRRAISQMGGAYARLMIGAHVRDCTSGYRLYRANTLRLIDLDGVRSDGYSFLIEVLALLIAAQARIEEVPITYVDRQRGASKISRRIVFEALGQTTRLGMRRVFRRPA